MPTKTKLITQNLRIRLCLLLFFNVLFFNLALLAQQSEANISRKTTQIKENPKRNNKIKTIVIDAGHGGHDPGTVNFKKKEKDVTLGIALLTGDIIKENFKDVKVIYTRSKDEFIDLKKRAQIANQARADLFISIHCNAIESHTNEFYGTETYVQDPKVGSYNLEVAKRENSAILYEEDYKANYDGYDPNSPETHILLSMFQNAYLGQSISFAQAFEFESARFAKRKSRGVRQAGFLVLKATTMPSVLIETGFLSNENEKDFLVTEEGQLKMALTIARAFYRYKQNIEFGESLSKNLSIELKYPKKFKASEYSMKDSDLVKIKNKVEPAVVSVNHPGITFRLQLLASQTMVDTTDGILKGIPGVVIIREGKVYKCYGKEHNSLDTLNEDKLHLRNNGFKDIFAVAFQNGNKISMSEAQEKLGSSPK